MSDMIKPVTSNIGIDISYFTNSNNKGLRIDSAPEVVDEDKPKRGRPKKEETALTGMIGSGNEMQRPVSCVDYYSETNNMIKGAIYEIDALNTDIKEELGVIKASKTMKNKYNYFTELASASGSLLSTKIGAIKELNNSITRGHDFDIKKAKEMASMGDSGDKAVMDLYSAIIGGNSGLTLPSTPSMAQMMNMSTGMIPASDNGAAFEYSDPGFSNYLNTKTPEQNAMVMETNPFIETVVIYDQSTNNKQFANIDTRTGQQVSNMPLKDSMFLEDTTININSGLARNANLNETYKLILVGQPDSIHNF